MYNEVQYMKNAIQICISSDYVSLCNACPYKNFDDCATYLMEDMAEYMGMLESRNTSTDGENDDED